MVMQKFHFLCVFCCVFFLIFFSLVGFICFFFVHYVFFCISCGFVFFFSCLFAFFSLFFAKPGCQIVKCTCNYTWACKNSISCVCFAVFFFFYFFSLVGFICFFFLRALCVFFAFRVGLCFSFPVYLRFFFFVFSISVYFVLILVHFEGYFYVVLFCVFCVCVFPCFYGFLISFHGGGQQLNKTFHEGGKLFCVENVQSFI